MSKLHHRHVRLAAAGGLLVLLLSARPARAQFAETAPQIIEAIGALQKAYSLYKQGKDFLEPQPTTAELIEQAVRTLETLIVDTQARNLLSEAETALRSYRDAQFASSPANLDLLKQFDTQAATLLDKLQQFLGPGSNARFSNALGGVYNVVLPLYLANHLKGRTWGSPLPRANLETDVISRALVGLQLDYDMVGSTSVIAGMPTNPADTTGTSRLMAYVTASATAQGAIQPTATHKVVYFKTNATTQAVQKGAAGILAFLKTTSASTPERLLDRTTGRTVTVDPAGWTNNWRGRANAIWTSVQPAVDGVKVTNEPCPHDSGQVAVWQLKFGMASFLCDQWQRITKPRVGTSVYNFHTYHETCPGGGLCSENTQCQGNEFASSTMFGNLQCVQRIDYNRDLIPMHGTQTRVDKTFSGLTEAGAFYDLPAGAALTGYDPSAYQSNVFGYWYATANLPNPLYFQGWTVVPGGGLFSSAPAVTMRSSTNIDVFGRGTDFAMYYNGGFSVDEGRTFGWTGWSYLGGQFLGKASATSWGPSTRNLAVAGRGFDSRPLVSVCAAPSGSCSFSAWNAIPSPITMSDDPAIVYKAPYLYVFAREYFSARVYWARNDVGASYSPAGWTGWTVLSDATSAAPAAAVVDGVLTVVVRGSDNRFYTAKSSDGQTYGKWQTIGTTTFASSPAISGWTGGHLDVSGTATGTGEALVATSTNGGSSWSAFQSIGGVLIDAPAAASPGLGRMELFGIGSDGQTMFRNSYRQ